MEVVVRMCGRSSSRRVNAASCWVGKVMMMMMMMYFGCGCDDPRSATGERGARDPSIAVHDMHLTLHGLDISSSAFSVMTGRHTHSVVHYLSF